MSAGREVANPDCQVILMTGRGTMETVMRATEGGAFDYIAKPFELDRLLDTIHRAEESLTPATRESGRGSRDRRPPETEMVASSPQWSRSTRRSRGWRRLDVTVLIQGETGTGKELIARMLHRYSPRAERPFVAVDCGAIAPTLVESELFGALRGAYTGADRDRIGYLEAANHGTVFLDEIGEIDTGFQLKLLRFLQEHEIRPVGSTRPRPIDVRVIAATNKDLIEAGCRRQVPGGPLVPAGYGADRGTSASRRHGDIPLLAQYFVDRRKRVSKVTAKLTESGVRALSEHTWPGNVRQMQHLIERLCILAPGGRIDEVCRPAPP